MLNYIVDNFTNSNWNIICRKLITYLRVNLDLKLKLHDLTEIIDIKLVDGKITPIEYKGIFDEFIWSLPPHFKFQQDYLSYYQTDMPRRFEKTNLNVLPRKNVSIKAFFSLITESQSEPRLFTEFQSEPQLFTESNSFSVEANDDPYEIYNLYIEPLGKDYFTNEGLIDINMGDLKSMEKKNQLIKASKKLYDILVEINDKACTKYCIKRRGNLFFYKEKQCIKNNCTTPFIFFEYLYEYLNELLKVSHMRLPENLNSIYKLLQLLYTDNRYKEAIMMIQEENYSEYAKSHGASYIFDIYVFMAELTNKFKIIVENGNQYINIVKSRRTRKKCIGMFCKSGGSRKYTQLKKIY
jgi:hypothetical protein